MGSICHLIGTNFDLLWWIYQNLGLKGQKIKNHWSWVNMKWFLNNIVIVYLLYSIVSIPKIDHYL